MAPFVAATVCAVLSVHGTSLSAGGTHWYHPHHHGSTGIQAGGGAVGALIVEDHAGQLPAEVAALEEMVFVLAHVNMPELKAVAQKYESNCQDAGGSADECDDKTWSDGATEGSQVDTVLVNGMSQPVVSINANQWYRWRLIFAAVDAILKPSLPGCEIKLLAKDGIYLNDAPRDIEEGYMGPGTRADWLIRCSAAGSYEFGTQQVSRRLSEASTLTDGADAAAAVEQLLATVEVTDAGKTACTLPEFTVNRPCYLVDLTSTAAEQTVSLRIGSLHWEHSTDYLGDDASGERDRV